MKLYYNKNSKDPTYYGQQGFRNGKKATTRNVIKFGKHSELLKITDDPLAYVQEQIKEWNEEHRVTRDEITRTINFNQHLSKGKLNRTSSVKTLNIGYYFLQYIMKDFCLKDFFNEKCKDSKISSEYYTLNRFLVYSRIMRSGTGQSLLSSYETYFEKPEINSRRIPEYEDFLANNCTEYLSWLYDKTNSDVTRDTSVLYYYCVNFCAESGREDNFIDHVTREKINGLRQFGVNNTQSYDILEEAGLLADSQGIPVTMCLHPEDVNEKHSVFPLEEEVLNMIPEGAFICCADSLDSYNLRKFRNMGGKSFVVTQPAEKLSDIIRKEILKDCDYRLLSDNKEVSLEHMQSFDLSDESNKKLYNDFAYKVIDAEEDDDQRIIIKFSRKMLEYQRSLRLANIRRAERFLRKNDAAEIENAPDAVKYYIKKSEKTGSEYVLDEDKIAAEEKYDGFYAIITNIKGTVRDISEILEKYYSTSERCRSIMSDFDTCPAYNSSYNKITTRFLICYTAVLVLQILRAKLNIQGNNFNGDEIIETINSLVVFNEDDIGYTAVYNDSEVLDALVKLTNLPLGMQQYRPTDLNKMLRKILN